MTTMDEKYGDGSKCLVCEKCGLCIDHGDCKADGCGEEVGKPEQRQIPASARLTDMSLQDIDVKFQFGEDPYDDIPPGFKETNMETDTNFDSAKVGPVGVDALVGQFQCPGCVCGNDIDCGRYQYDPAQLRCVSHVLGTHIGLGNPVALGMPKGFNKPGWTQEGPARNKIDIRLHPAHTAPRWDNLNVPVWAMEKDGFLFVRTFAPRVNFTWVDVIEGGTLSLCPAAINVAEFIDEID